MSRRVSRSPASEIPSLFGKAEPEVVSAVELLAARSQTHEGDLAKMQSTVESLAQSQTPLGIHEIKKRLQVNGGNALDVTGLLGVLSQPQKPGVPLLSALPQAIATNNGELVNLNGQLYYLDARTDPGAWKPIAAIGSVLSNTHTNRLASYPAANYPLGTMFWETDRTAMYYIIDVAGVNTWSLMFTRPQVVLSIGALPSDLGTQDAGYLAEVVNDAIGQFSKRWTGTQWNFHRGWYRAVEASRPSISDCDAEFLFVSIDYGEQVWRNDTSAWVLWRGFGGPMQGTLSPDQKPSLGTDDEGFRFYSTDFFREFTWDGVAWDYSPGEVKQAAVILSAITNADDGWHFCDGSTIDISENVGTVTSITLPDFSVGHPFVRGDSSPSSGSFGTAGSSYNEVTLVPYIKL